MRPADVGRRRWQSIVRDRTGRRRHRIARVRRPRTVEAPARRSRDDFPSCGRRCPSLGAADNRVYSLNAATGRVLRTASVLKNPTDPSIHVALDPSGKRVKWYRKHTRTLASEQPQIWRDTVVRSIASSDEYLFIGTEEGVVSAVRP